MIKWNCYPSGKISERHIVLNFAISLEHLKYVSDRCMNLLILLLLMLLKVNGYNVHQNHSHNLAVIGSRCMSSLSSSHTNEQTRGNSSTSQSSTDVCSIPSPFISSVNKLCLATLDADGHCLEAHGSLRVLLEVM